MTVTPPNDEFVLRILADKEKGLTPKQIQSFHGITKNQYEYIVYKLARKLSEQSPNFISKKKANTQQLIAQKKKQVKKDHKKLQPVIESTNEYMKTMKEKEKFSLKALVSKIFSWYRKKT